MGQKPECVLCPNKGGAMKSTKSGNKWAHVSCALWIPEVSIGSVDRMEPITKISSIPASRWALVCVLCRERVGACIQCSVKTCKTAYHVTCAFQHGLEMRAIIEDENAEDGVKLRSYCQKHSVKKEPKNSANPDKAEKAIGSGSEAEERVVPSSTNTNKKKIRKEMTTEEKNHARQARLAEIQSEFNKHVSVKDISCHLLDVDQEGINHIYNYWILKRKAGGNEPLLLPKAGDVDVMSQTDQEQADVEKMKMFVHLRQDLERVRNLCYMVSRREKFSRSFFKIREQVFHKQMAVLGTCKKPAKLDDISIKATMGANHGPSIYDVLYSCDSVKDAKAMKIDEMIDAIVGNSSSKSNKEINGNVKKLDAQSRYYNKMFNGGPTISATEPSKKLNNIYDSLSSESDTSILRETRRKSHRTSSSLSVSSASTSEDEAPARKSPVKPKAQPLPAALPTPAPTQPKKKGRPPGSTKQAVAEKRKQMNAINAKSKPKSLSLYSSSEEDVGRATRTRVKSPRSRLPTDDTHLTDDSDDLVPIRNSSGHSIPTTGISKQIQPSAIYSDSDSSSTDKDNKTDHTVSDSQQPQFRTKAAMKEFNINELLPFDKSKKITEAPDAKKPGRKAILSPTPSKKAQPAKASPAKSRRPSTKLATLTSDSEGEGVSSSNNDKNASHLKKDVVPDFLVVPQREAAKKASENLMKTNSALMVQSITGMASEKNRREIREKLDETLMSSKLVAEVAERESSKKDAKESKTKSSKPPKDVKKSTTTAAKDERKSEVKKPLVKDEKVSEKERDEKSPSEQASVFTPYVPQRQAAKKAAEHIKGLGTSSQPAPPVVPEEKPKAAPSTPSPSKKAVAERRKSVAIDLSSTSSSSGSSSGSSSASSSDSESENEPKPSKAPVASKAKSTPSRRPSVAAAGPKAKAKDLPFLDKAAKSAAAASKSSSSSSSSDSDSSSSDRADSTRLPEKGNHTKRKAPEKAPAKKPVAASPKKPAAAAKKEADKPPSRRPSVKATPAAASSSKAAASNRSPQKSVPEPATVPEAPVSSRKRSISTAASPAKVSGHNKSRAAESSKGDLAKLPDKRKSSVDLKEADMKSPNEAFDSLKKRKTSVSSSSPVKEPSTVDVKEKSKKDESNLRRSSRSETLASKAAQEKEPEVSKTSESERIKSPEPKVAQTKSKQEVLPEKQAKPMVAAKESPSVIEIADEPEPKAVTAKVGEDRKMEVDVPKPVEKLHIETEKQNASIDLVKPSMLSPMVSIPTANLNSGKINNHESADEMFNKVLQDDKLFNHQNSIFSIPKVVEKEDTERETYHLIEKLRKKNQKTSIADNNNIVNETADKLSPCMLQNENKSTPKHDEPVMQQMTPQSPLVMPAMKAAGSPSVLSKKDQEFNDLKKTTSPWNPQQLQHQNAEAASINNYQRNILTSNNNKINSTLEQSPAPASCMVIEQQQKQLAACQKINEENNMLASNRGSNMFMSPMGAMNMLNDQQANMDLFHMQMQPQPQSNQKWPKDQKSLNMKMMQQQANMNSNAMKRAQPGMENLNMLNDLNHQAIKNAYPQLPHKGPMTNDFTSATMQAHALQGNFNSYNFSENASQFTSAVSLLPPPDMNSQNPFPSPGQAMYAPNFSNAYSASAHLSSDPSTMMQGGGLHSKPNNAADMTQNNLRFGAQNFCTPINQQQQFQQQQSQPPHLQPMNDLSMNSKGPQNVLPPTNSEQSLESNKKSPSKSTRSSPRNSTPTHGGKTPQKSPSKSPRQPSTPASVESLSRQNSQKGKSTPNRSETKQKKSRANSQASPATTPAEHRGKGRARANKTNKGRFLQGGMPFMPFNSGIDYINKKLVGTVYDFSADDEFNGAPSVENLRAMRDRTKSVDVFNKLNRDGSSQSPKMTKASAKQSIQHSSLTLNNHTLPGAIVNANPLPVTPAITDLNLVNMPGPVDMRTYNSYDNTNDSYNSQLLGAFAAGNVDQTLNDIDEEQEKELQTALKASNDKQKTPTNNTAAATDVKSSVEVSNIVEESVDSEASFAKVSLSDSRNQLKLKIKGPLAHPDLHLHSVAPIIPQNVSGGASNASSNRRQMRKKELLQQYWNQGLNIDQEQTNSHTVDLAQASSSISRIGGIPKAVDSMGLGLLKDEFQDFNYAEYKKRKRFALKGDPHSFDNDFGAANNSDISNTANDIDPLSLDYNKKRRNRANRGGQQAAAPNPPPKLKIKIGSDIMETSGSDLPPKKRHIAAPPSYQDLKRESMNFRKEIMDKFSEQKKSKEHRTKEEKREKKEKKKKKKEKKRSMQVVQASVAEGAPVKLILKIGNKSMSTVSNASADNSNSSEMNKTAPPLKLKFSRSSQGNGEYNVSKNSNAQSTPTTSPASTSMSTGSMVTSTPTSSSNNNLQPPIIDASDINSIKTKKLEVSLERLEDVAKAKSALLKQSDEIASLADKNSIAPPTSKDCEVR